MPNKRHAQDSQSKIPAVQMCGITKRFGPLIANHDVDLEVQPGEIHALIGENGAGKSTLMGILYGLQQPDSGNILIHGRQLRFSGPGEAILQGIGMVHQHFMLVPTLSVAENVVLGMEPTRVRGLRFDRTKAEKQTKVLSERYGLELDARANVSDLSVGEQQRLEILKVLYRGAEILILDEPTAVLTPQETLRLFDIFKTLQTQGKTIILITHKLQEVMSISQTVTVMRKGKIIGSVPTRNTSEADLAEMMVGRSVLFKVARVPHAPSAIEKSPIVLKLDRIHANSNRGLPALRDVSFEIHAGEVFGIAGVEGNGQTELIEVVSCLRKPVSGEIHFLDRLDTDEGPADRLRLGLAHIPEDRHARGLILDYSVADNMILGLQRQKRFGTPWRVSTGPIHRFADKLVKDFDVHPQNADMKVKMLSGGNQQKVIVARELSRIPKLLLAAQPTRGVDVGAIEFIHKKIIEVRDAGAAVLLISAELSEILSLSDRVAVLHRGKIMGILPVQKCSEEKLGLMMGGKKG